MRTIPIKLAGQNWADLSTGEAGAQIKYIVYQVGRNMIASWAISGKSYADIKTLLDTSIQIGVNASDSFRNIAYKWGVGMDYIDPKIGVEHFWMKTNHWADAGWIGEVLNPIFQGLTKASEPIETTTTNIAKRKKVATDVEISDALKNDDLTKANRNKMLVIVGLVVVGYFIIKRV